jgi:hypothetical protein
MSIAGLSSNSFATQQFQQNPFQEIKQDFEQLSSALQSGNLSDAQSAYSSIQQLLQGSQGSSLNGNSTDPTTLQTDFATLGQALQGGNLNQAQTAFTQLESDFQANRQSTGGAGATAPPQDLYVPSQSQQQTPAQQAQQDYTQLANALQSGSLTNAQSAYAALQQLVQPQNGTNGASNASFTTNDPIENDFNALGQALAAGNLSQAQSAFSQLQSAVQAAEQPGTQSAQGGTQVHGHHHHHHHGGGGGSSAQSSTSTTSTTATSSASTTSSNLGIYA